MSGPRTEAGKRLLDWLYLNGGAFRTEDRDHIEAAILAIEAEAAMQSSRRRWLAEITKYSWRALASPDTGVVEGAGPSRTWRLAEGAGLDALPDNACGVMGLCELLKGHEGKHTTSVDRALEGVVLRATHAASPGAFNAPLDVERLARAMCETMKRRHGGNMPNCMVKEGPWTATHRAEAQAIAAEYARLASDSEPASESPGADSIATGKDD